MCLLVKVAPNTIFPLAWFKDCYGSNPDGLGIAYVKDGVVVSEKYLPSDPSDAFIWLNKHAPKDTEYALHWRMRTHGAVDLERVHPYPITDDILLMHNGILSIQGDTTKESDTQIYARTYGRALSASLHEPLVREMIGKGIGSNNRFIFIHAEHGLLLVNEHTGVTTERFPGCWFSNTYAWSPRHWGVDTGYSGWSGHMHGATWMDDEIGGEFPFARSPRSVDWKGAFRAAEAEADADPVGANVVVNETGLTDEQELLVVVEQMFKHARATAAFDSPAQRFLNWYDNEDEFVLACRDGYEDDADAVQQLTLTMQYIEAGQCDFDDVLSWFMPENDDGGSDDLSLAEPSNSNYSG